MRIFALIFPLVLTAAVTTAAADIRQLALDLTGLPPTPAAVDAFVADRAPDAYEKLVDRLLASPTCGDRWARMWLDLARFADSTGYGSDAFRLNIWPYRDWLIGAFNRNLPFDQYYQLFAIFNQTDDSDRGDEEPTLPLPSAEERAQQEKLRGEIAALEQKLNGNSAELEAEQHEWEAQMSRKVDWEVLAPVEARGDREVQLVPQPDGSLLAKGREAGTDTYTVNTKALRGATAVRLEALTDDSLPGRGPGRADGGNAVVSEIRLGVVPQQQQAGVRGRFVRVELPGDGRLLSLAEVQVIKAGDNIATKGTATQSSTDFDGPAKLANDGNTDGEFTRKSVTHTATEKNPWWEVDLGAAQDVDAIFVWNRTDAGVETRLANFKVSVLDDARKPVWEKAVSAVPRPSARLALPGERDLPLAIASADFSQQDFDVARAIDGDGKSGWAFAPQLGQPHAAVFELKDPAVAEAGDLFVFTIRQTYGQKHTLGRFRLAATTAEPPVRELPASIRAALAIEPTERSPEQREELLKYFRPFSKQSTALTREIDAKKAALAKIKPLQVPMMRELAPAKQREN